jgi:hypothetical protein
MVLPIRYRFSDEGPGKEGDPAPLNSDTWVYRKKESKDIEDIWRRSAYFTVDTSYALFNRAHWFELQNVPNEQVEPTGKVSKDDVAKAEGKGVWTSFSYHAPGVADEKGRVGEKRPITVEVAPPWVVLFEAENATKALEKQLSAEETFFQIGFLYLDCYLRTETAKDGTLVCLEDLMEFNERARCIWSPYAEYLPAYLNIMEKRPALLGQSAPDIKTGNFLDMWAAAVGYRIEIQGHRIWLSDYTMRKDTREWVENCAGSHLSWDGKAPGDSPVPLTAIGTESHTGWLAGTDYRAFVWTFAYTESSLSSYHGGPADRPDRYGHWVKFMNVDPIWKYWEEPANIGVNAHDTSAFERDWARERTYARWAHYGSYYGISPHSGCLLTNYKGEIQFDRHFKTLYFDQALLLLYLRVMAFQLSIRMARLGAEFADKVPNTTGKPARSDGVESFRGGFREVRQRFMSFSSLYQFPLLSTQQQGVELYTLFRKHMDIDGLYRDVANEIDTWDRVIAQHAEEFVSRRVEIITFWGLPVTIVTLLLTSLQYLLGLPFGWIPVGPRTPTAWESWFSIPFDWLNRRWSWAPLALAVGLWTITFWLIKRGVTYLANRRPQNVNDSLLKQKR